jgi:hypothetical protein
MSGTILPERVLLQWTAIPEPQRKYFLTPLVLAIVVFVFLVVNIFMGKTGFPGFTPFLSGAFALLIVSTVASAKYFQASFAIRQRLDGTRSLLVRERFQTSEYSWPLTHQVFYYMNPIFTGRTVRYAPVLLLHLCNESGQCLVVLKEELGYLYQPPAGWTGVDERSGLIIPPGAKIYLSFGLRLLNLEKLKEQLDRLAVAFPDGQNDL